jgi:hypothetical protein
VREFRIDDCKKRGGKVHYGKKGIKRDINYNFSRTITMTITAETIILRKYALGKV